MPSQKFERFSSIFLLAGLTSLIIAFLVLGLGPASMVNKSVSDDDLPAFVPEDFQKYYTSVPEYRAALKRGRDHYVAEACWHCHSQYVRPVSNESLRYGPVSQPGEYQNPLNLPQLFGTRRVGPDLSRESGKHTNDWHFAHLYNPKSVEPRSVMPTYSWYFEEKMDQDKMTVLPKQEAIDLVAYLQWLGSGYAGATASPTTSDAITMPPRE